MCTLGTRFYETYFLGGPDTQGSQFAEQGNIYVFYPAVGKVRMRNTIWQTRCLSEVSSIFCLENSLKICNNATQGLGFAVTVTSHNSAPSPYFLNMRKSERWMKKCECQGVNAEGISLKAKSEMWMIKSEVWIIKSE